jgi:DNA-binding XRE family transcriptional regulator
MKIYLSKEKGQQIRILRKRSGYTDTVAGKYLKIHRTTIGKIERGERNIALETVRKIEQLYKIKLVSEEIIEGSLHPPSLHLIDINPLDVPLKPKSAKNNKFPKNNKTPEEGEPLVEAVVFVPKKTIKNSEHNLYAPEKWQY